MAIEFFRKKLHELLSLVKRAGSCSGARLFMTPTHTRGFTIFFAMLVGSLALSVGVAIYDLTVRELDLSGTATQSQYAIYAADTGAECALYWDFKCTLGACTSGGAGKSAFATSSNSVTPLSGVVCSGQDIASAWVTAGFPQANATAATTTFTLTFSPQPYCASVTVVKRGTPLLTTITSKGYNTCVSGPNTRLERVLQVTY
jgi:hypothetical protein